MSKKKRAKTNYSVSHQPESELPSSGQVDLWLQKVIVFILHLTVLTTPLFFLFNTNELFEFNKLMLVYIYTILAVAALAGRVVIGGIRLLRPTYLDIPLLLFLIAHLLSTLFSIHPYTSLVGYYSRFHGGLLSYTSYIMLYYVAVHTLNRVSLQGLWITSALSAGLVAIYAILERFGASFSCVLVGGGLSVDCWVQDVQSRVFASFGQPNWLAAYAILLIPLFASLALITTKTWQRIVFSGVALLLVVALLFTRSRSGIIGWYVAGGVWASLVFAWYWLRNRLSLGNGLQSLRSIPAIAVIFVTAFLVIFIEAPFTPNLSSFQPDVQETDVATADPLDESSTVNRLDEGGTDSGEIRKIVWTGALRVWQRYPILGSGVETFAYSYYLDRPIEHNLVSEWDFLYNKAHNELLNFLATTGVVGLFSYLLLLSIFALYILRRLGYLSSSRDPNAPAHALHLIGLASGVAALSVSNFFGFSTVMVTALMFIFFAAAFVLDEDPSNPPANKKLSTTHWLSFGVILLISMWLLVLVRNHWVADMRYVQAKTLLNAGQLEPGMQQLESAIRLNPSEAHYLDELSQRYAQYAVAFAAAGDATRSAELAVLATQSSELVMQLNPEQLNFHKTRARMFLTLSSVDPEFLHQGLDVLKAAHDRAPTDAKLLYNQGVVELAMDQTEAGVSSLLKAIELKPNYVAARWQLALALESTGQTEEALAQTKYILEHIAPDYEEAKLLEASLSAKLAE